jgi:hypothetical protein
MRQYTRIVTNKVLRDESTERWLIEARRERVIYIVMLLGACLTLYGIVK